MNSTYRPTPYDEAILLCLAHLGGATAALIQGICMPGRALRTAQEVLSIREQGGLIQQHHRSVRIGEATRRLASVWELAPKGRTAIRKHALAPAHLASMARRTLSDAALLSNVVLAIYHGTPLLAGLTVGHEPAINPENAHGRAEALITVHQWADPEDAMPAGAIPWMPIIIREEEYQRITLMIELDDGIPPEGLRRRASCYPSPEVWHRAKLGLAPIPLWVVPDKRRLQQIQRAIGRAFEASWIGVTEAGLADNTWQLYQAARLQAQGALDHCLTLLSR
ncbi:hypothetical protein EKD04_025475 [Chloroflexales bacterium ZM16-3]|nr:hypothetical protein [Chloroflexales bacterium ZM16-3]